MKTPYIAPRFKGKAFNCPHCGAYARQHWINFANNLMAAPLSITAAECENCHEISCWYKSKMVVPSSGNIEMPNADMPDKCKELYEEARGIINQSARGATALLRLCLQVLMKELGESGEHINSDIASLVKKGLSAKVQKAADVCRVIGNNAVHPGQIDINDSPEIALSLFKLLNFIVDHEITQPKEIDSLFDALPKSAKEGIQKRDQT